ncbi:hypothetical protein RIR_jg42584.t1 [Rhizophagus irregularis DAOM 181602=DAOM 197198]|nr:hypothetical protein RIR_jg42584.t1 [Rhizophagus irregularis DAOM 181602=DAOM 197198]
MSPYLSPDLPISPPTLILPVCNQKFLMLLIHKRVLLPNLVQLWKNWTPSLLQKPSLPMIEHQFISGVSQGLHPPNSAIPNNNSPNNPSSPSFSSPLINFGQINVNGLCSPVRQLHLLNYFLHSSFGVLSLNDTRLTSSSAKFIYQNEYSQHNFKSYWAPSPSNSRPHDGVGLLLHHPYEKSLCDFC